MATEDRLWRIEEGEVIWQWNGSFVGSKTKKWLNSRISPLYRNFLLKSLQALYGVACASFQSIPFSADRK
ncbi:hypothetical protein L218DRAFT_966829 [Marasmius fiardii PR-910]|nr:hypothetical protein L218DRAFT_966829 [Marasmius fiardii PR-910]